ncbi:hypothetical protein EDC04DRAFT_2899542 [Pisolithus marmoratus]|nr:hypothetical protein EDC04DRAFT_2899542 [Pisolithus marmoratus]
MDLNRPSHLSPPTSTSLSHAFQPAYSLLPPSPSSSHTSHLPPLKRCLRLNLDPPQSLVAHQTRKVFG